MTDEANILENRHKIISGLTEARIEKGFSQQALAEMIGTKRSNICRIEAGRQNISLDTFLKMAAALGKDVSVQLHDRSEKDESETRPYCLRLYDTELLRFSLRQEGLSGMKAEILFVNEKYRPLFPLGLEVSDTGIAKWLAGRILPRNRTFAGEILAHLGLTFADTKGIIDVCKGLSLNDSYWVVPQDFDGKFADYNLYENRFSEILSLVAYTGNAGSHEVFTTSPELTTNGMLPKAWRFLEGDGIYLYKGGTSGGANTGKEPFSEYYAYQVAERMGINAVYYDLENWKGILASKCKLFTDIDTAFVPTGRIVKSGGIAACLDFYETIGPNALENFKDMLVFDAVVYNDDRHYSNFGVLRDNRTGKILDAAPIFDNGRSLFSEAMPESFKDIGEYAKTRTNPYGISYDAICREIMGDRQRRKLRKMLDFTFTRHPTLNLPEYRLEAIERQISQRARELLALPRFRSTVSRDGDAR